MLATTGACLRAAAAVLALLVLATSPRACTLVYLRWRRVCGSTSTQPALSANGLSRMKSGATCGGTTCSMSKASIRVSLLPSAKVRTKVARLFGPSTATRRWEKLRSTAYLSMYFISAGT
ncbi:hypothetical protein D3C71_1444240 [compost metagenome]